MKRIKSVQQPRSALPNRWLGAAVLSASWLLTALPAWAQFDRLPPDYVPQPVQIAGVKTTFVPLSNGEPGVLYEPVTPGPKARIGLFVMHASGDYLRFSACSELSRRGYRVLCANNSTDKSGTFDSGVMDKILLQAKYAVVFLRHVPGVQKVVLFGHSGGATIMTAYQDIAENGVAVCQDAGKIHTCPDELAGLPRADGIVLADANWGQAEMSLFSVDPAVLRNDDGMTLDPSLDMYNPANGFSPSGSHYSAGFVHRFLAAEGARENALIRLAQQRLALIEAGKGDYVDDEPFIIAGASFIGNRLFTADPSLLAQSRKPFPLLHADGSVTTQIVHSVRVPEGDQNPTRTMGRGTLKTTVRNFLSSYAIRTTRDYGYDADTIRGVDWTSSYASPPGDVEGVTVPLLALGMTGHWEGLAAETIYDHARSTDKSAAFVEGATHAYTPCTRCAQTPGQFGDTVKITYDYIDAWLSKPGRF